MSDKKYSNCSHYIPGCFFDDDYKHYCAPHAKTLGEQLEQAEKIDKSKCEKCEHFRSRYIEYPLTIDSLELQNYKFKNIVFEPVKVRLVEDNKTYFGIYIGNLPYRICASFTEEDKKLKISNVTGPCILLPEQKKIVFGHECWWSRINPDENFSEISDEDISNVWYVKLLKDIQKNK